MKNHNAPMSSDRFYVYMLADPRDKIFYVGKGTGPRVHEHELEAKTNCQCHKCRKIRKIWRTGGAVCKYIIFTTNDENEAYEYEESLITEIGIKNLCNKALGGRGKRSIPTEVLHARREAHENGKFWREHNRQFRQQRINEELREIERARRPRPSMDELQAQFEQEIQRMHDEYHAWLKETGRGLDTRFSGASEES